MRHDLRWKSLVIFLVVALFALVLYKLPIRLGLDLKGGIELLLAPDYRIGSSNIYKLGDLLSAKAKEANIPAPEVSPLGTLDGDRYDGLKFTFASAQDAERAVNAGVFPQKYQLNASGEIKNLNLIRKVKGNVVELTVLQDAGDFPEDSLERSLSVISHRINEASAGMAEADVRLDGKGRINVQLPGISSLEEARDLISATGRLTFRINNQIVMDGTDLKNVYVSFQQGEGYVINFEFKGKGARQFAKVTSENVNKFMAIYLDEEKLMEPLIKQPITGGEGYISLGGRTKAEAENYAILMKSGALPISLKVVQETQVAPTLGKEIVHQSMVAGIISLAMVVLFMLIFYGLPGMMADFALVLYGIMVLGVMALFRGVLTLPGVAGFILSLGMAVDANIIIFERIKDEIRNGKRVRAAIQGGFHRAFTTILDSNLTTLISAFVLLFYGTGPVKGFAVTLGLGVIISMFTAIFVTRVFIEWRVDHDPDRYLKHFGGKEVEQV